MHDNPKVFISYSHMDEIYENRILEFCNKLRAEGIDANVDLYEDSPSEGWPRWMENQIREADYVLVICNKSYYDKCYMDKSKGISWEVNITFQYIYDNNSDNKKIIPICFCESDIKYILTPLKPFTYYNVETKEEYDKLYWRLRGIKKIQRPSLGSLRPLPEKERKTMFFSTPIDLEKWNKAHWKGMLYLFIKDAVPILGIIFENYDIAKEIFYEWKKNTKNDYADNFISVDYIVPPFPKNCWVYSDGNRNYGKGYFVHIGPNVNESIKRAIDSGIEPDDFLLTAMSRYQWMDEVNGSKNRDLFQKNISINKEYLLVPIGIKNTNKSITMENINIDLDCALKMKHVRFKPGIEIKDDDICKDVLQNTMSK